MRDAATSDEGELENLALLRSEPDTLANFMTALAQTARFPFYDDRHNEQAAGVLGADGNAAGEGEPDGDLALAPAAPGDADESDEEPWIQHAADGELLAGSSDESTDGGYGGYSSGPEYSDSDGGWI